MSNLITQRGRVNPDARPLGTNKSKMAARNNERSILTRTLLVGRVLLTWSPWGLEISFVVKAGGAVMLLFRFEYKTSVICHNVNTQNVKIARIERQTAHPA